MIYAAGIIILILALGVFHEHYERIEALEKARFWEKETLAAEHARDDTARRLRALGDKYAALAAEQNGTKRRAIRAELYVASLLAPSKEASNEVDAAHARDASAKIGAEEASNGR